MINDSLRQRFLGALMVCVLGLAAPGYGQSLEPRGLLVEPDFDQYAVSPDGRMIAFQGVVDHGSYPDDPAGAGISQGDLFVYDLRSKKVSKITRNWYEIGDLAWSDDSQFLAFIGSPHFASRRGVWVVKPLSPARLLWSGDLIDYDDMRIYPRCWWTALDGVLAFGVPYDNKKLPYLGSRWLLCNVRTHRIVAAIHPAWEKSAVIAPPGKFMIPGIDPHEGESAVIAVDRVHHQVFVLAHSRDPSNKDIYVIWCGAQRQFQFEDWKRLTSIQVSPLAVVDTVAPSVAGVLKSGARIAFSVKSRRIAFPCGSTLSNRGLCIVDLMKHQTIKTIFYYPLEWSSNGVLLACVVQKIPRNFQGISPKSYNGDVYIIRYDGRLVKKFPGAFWAHWLGASNKLVLWRHGKLDIVRAY